MPRQSIFESDFPKVVNYLVTMVSESTDDIRLLTGNDRSYIVNLLTLLMSDPVAFTNYRATLIDELERTEMRIPLLEIGGCDIPDDIIASVGFEKLSDPELLDFATSPEALSAIKEFLEDPDTQRGQWFFDAIIAVEQASETPLVEEIYEPESSVQNEL